MVVIQTETHLAIINVNSMNADLFLPQTLQETGIK